MPYDPDRFAFWHRWVQDCITAFHRQYVPQGELYRMARLGPIDREAVYERFLARPPAYSTKQSLHRALRRAVKHVAHRRPLAHAIIATPEEVYILKVKRHPTSADLERLAEQATLFPATPAFRPHAHKPLRLVLLAHQLDGRLLCQASATGIQLLPVPRPGKYRGRLASLGQGSPMATPASIHPKNLPLAFSPFSSNSPPSGTGYPFFLTSASPRSPRWPRR